MEEENKDKKSSMQIEIPEEIEADLAQDQQETSAQEGPSEEAPSKEKEYYERLLHVTADFDNFKKRIKKEKADYVKFATERLIKEIIPVLDNFERALEGAREAGGNESILKGVELIFNQLSAVLKKEGVKSVDSLGAQFDPLIHEAISQIPSKDHEPNTVISEQARAYFLNNKLIRPATVIVASAPASEAAEESPEEAPEIENEMISQEEAIDKTDSDEQ